MKREAVINWAAWLCVGVLILIATRSLIFHPRDPATLLVETIAGHEYEYNLWRMIGMATALYDGLSGRWLQAFSHGWGYPLFHYTGPLPYLFGGLMMLLGFEPHAALNICWIAAYIGAGCAMFWATRPFFGRWGAVLAACCYLLAPYHLVDTYVRTNIAETSAFIFPPLILGAIMRARHTFIPSIAVGALAVMLLALTHLLSFYIVGLSLGIFSLAYLPLLPTRKERIDLLITSAAIGGIGLGLSAFFWLPAIANLSATKGTEAMTSILYHEHFVYFPQLFSHAWEYGGSEPGPKDYMSYSLGPSIVVFALLALGASLYRVYRPKRTSQRKTGKKKTPVPVFDLHRFVIAAGIGAVVSTFLTLNPSIALWKVIPGMPSVQFPWRFLLPASTFLAFMAGALPRLLADFNRKLSNREAVITLTLSLVVISLHWNFARVGDYGHVERDRLSAEGMVELGVWTSSAHEFMPRNVLQMPYSETKREQIAVFYDEDIMPRRRIAKASMDEGVAKIILIPGPAGTLVLNQHWYPAWRANVDGEAIDTFAFPWHPFGPVAIAVPQSAYLIEFRYGYTAAGYFGIVLSLCTLFAMLGYVFRHKKHYETRLVPAAAICLVPLLIWHLWISIPRTQELPELIDEINKEVAAAELGRIRLEGSAWDEPGNVILDETGVRVVFDYLTHGTGIGLSLDSNDQYLVLYLNDDEVLDRGVVPERRTAGGMSNFVLTVPAPVMERGYDSIAIFPIDGDGSYSLGHVYVSYDQIHTTPVAPEEIVTEARPTLPIEQVAVRKQKGTWWDVPGNQVLRRGLGLQLTLDGVHHASRLDLSVDSNDSYFVKYLLGGKFMGGHLINPAEKEHGLALHSLDVPDKARDVGFNAIEIIPLAGDENYSLGHMILQGWWKTAEPAT